MEEVSVLLALSRGSSTAGQLWAPSPRSFEIKDLEANPARSLRLNGLRVKSLFLNELWALSVCLLLSAFGYPPSPGLLESKTWTGILPGL